MLQRLIGWLRSASEEREDSLDLSRRELNRRLRTQEAARRSGEEELCRDQIVEMARIVEDGQFRRSAAEGLADLHFEDDAATIRGWADGEDAPYGPQSSEELRRACFAAAVDAGPGDDGR